MGWEMIYKFKNNKWIKDGNIYKAVVLQEKFTAKKKIEIVKKPGKKKISFIVRSGEKVSLKKICIKKGKVYVQMKNKNGKMGWFSDTKKTELLFNESALVG